MGNNKTKDTRPARLRYWQSKTLQKHKIRNLVRCNGMSERDALEYWIRARKNRIKRWTSKPE